MTIRFTEGEGLGSEFEADGFRTDALDLTEELFRIALCDLNAALNAIRDGRFEAAKPGKQAVRDLAAMGAQVLEERRHVEKLRRQIAGTAGAFGTLDLGAARDEIGRRLACLRNARGD